MPYRRLLLIVFPVMLLALLGLSVALAALGRPALPVYQPMPEFSGTDHHLNAFSNADLSGKVWIADFIFTRCGAQCPLMTQKMKQIHDAVKSATFVSYTVDPNYDTPARLSEYSQTHDAISARWLFVAGDETSTNALTTALHMNTVDNPMLHSVSFVLVDKKGQVRGFYNAEDPEKMEQLKKDAKRLSAFNIFNQ